ncbi:MAG: hypothetical protein ACK4OM_02610 [Alphaproteobacteria bacterium]
MHNDTVYHYTGIYQNSNDFAPVKLHNASSLESFIVNIFYNYLDEKQKLEYGHSYLEFTDGTGITHHYNLLTGEESLISSQDTTI